MKIIDSFIFYNELDMLELRLTEIFDKVDHIVLVESTKTFALNDKELFFEKNKSRYSKFLDKIIHIVVDDLRSHSAIANEIVQRNSIDLGIQRLNLSDSDMILISDVDEIPDMHTILEHSHLIQNSHSPSRLFQDLYYYNLTCKQNGTWALAKAVSYGVYKKTHNPQEIRLFSWDAEQVCIHKAGWHFSYFGDIDFIKNKIQNFSHQEYNNEFILDDNKIKKYIENYQDLYGRDIGFSKIEIEQNNYLPKNIKLLLDVNKKKGIH